MEKTAFTIYLITLVLSPLLFGAVYTYAYTYTYAYAYTMISLGVLTGSLLLLVKNTRKDPKSGLYQFQFAKTDLNPLFFLLLVLLIFQVIPLPGVLLGLLSPKAG